MIVASCRRTTYLVVGIAMEARERGQCSRGQDLFDVSLEDRVYWRSLDLMSVSFLMVKVPPACDLQGYNLVEGRIWTVTHP